MRLQSMGFTGNEIENILYHSSEKDIAKLYSQKKQEIQNNIERDTRILKYLEKVTEVGIGVSWDGTWSIRQVPPFLYVENITNGELSANDMGCEVVKQWNRYFPIVSTCLRVGWDGNLEDSFRIRELGRGLMIDKRFADSMNVFRNSEVRFIDPGLALHYHMERTVPYQCLWEVPPFEAVLKEPLELCKKHRFSLKGDMYMIQQFTSTARDHNFVSQMVVIPLEDGE